MARLHKVSAGVSSATDYEQYAYDANGNPTSIKKRNGQSVALVYDNLNRLTARTYPSTADNVAYAYDLLGRRTAASFANASYSIGYAWDNAGRLASATAGGKAVGYQYDAAGNRVRTTWPEATPFYVTATFDALNRPTAIKELGTTNLASYAYAPQEVPLGDAPQEVPLGGDDLSRRTTVTLGNGSTTGYAYGTQGALSSLAHDLTGTAQDITTTYTRNQVQEIVGRTWTNDLYAWSGVANGTRAYTSNGQNQYTAVAGATLAYDGNGNLTGDGVWTYGYDLDNRLTSAAQTGYAATLAYDGEGRLRQTTLAGTVSNLLYDGTDLIGEYDAANVLLRRYVHGPGVDEPLVWYEGAGTTSKTWLYADHLGSIVAQADATGTSTATYSYGPFGEPNQTTGSRFRYTGQQFLGPLNLYYYKARFYSPGIGRFLQTDPIGYADDLNLYAYVGNNPANATDPSGEFWVQFGMFAVGAGIDIAAQMIIENKTWSNVSLMDAALSGVAAAVTGNVGGRLAQAALKGSITAGQAVGYTAATGAAAGATVSAVSEVSKGNAPDLGKMAIGAIGGGAGAGAGARLSSAAAFKLANMAASGGVLGGIANTTRSAMNFGRGVMLGGSVGEEGGKFLIDASISGLGKWAELSLAGGSSLPRK